MVFCSIILFLFSLVEKLFDGSPNAEADPHVTKSKFCKEPLLNRTFTFWEWFHAAMKLTREHLVGPWKDGHMIGFISKQQTEEFLLSSSSGTFLIRFSDSELGN